MVSGGRRKATDRSQAAKYRGVGAALLDSARALEALADDDSRYGNAIAVIAIHAAIAYNDAVTISYGAFKSTEGDHAKAPDALLAALRNPPADRVDQLRAIVKKKDSASYRGEYYRVADATSVLRRTEDFCRWAEEMYQNRPPA